MKFEHAVDNLVRNTDSIDEYYRPVAPGMGEAVFQRTIGRKIDGVWENWGDVADRVARGNASLFDGEIHSSLSEYNILRKHIASGATLMSGRHLQHGDSTQPNRGMEVFTNCATSPVSFMLFYLLLNGSGVGRNYDDDIVLVDWDYAPNLRCVLSSDHPDFDWSAHESLRDARHKYAGCSDTMWHEVADSREGWAKALEIYETAAFEKVHNNKLLILDFSRVRCKGSPINGMQNRPASGPVPLMNAFIKASTLKGSGIQRWRQAMFIDHYMAESVLVGGARRAARMSTKIWTDQSIFDFITIKRPIEYLDKTAEDILALRAATPTLPFGFLWSSNNSVMVDGEFWTLLRADGGDARTQHAKKVFKAITEAAYADGTGEPGVINAHKLVQKDDGWNDLARGDYIGSDRYQVEDETRILLSKLAKRAKKKKFKYLTNPCVPGDTLILTSNGYRRIEELVGQPTAIWNGIEWSEVKPFSTGYNPTVNVKFSDGTSLRCTPSHKFVLNDKCSSDQAGRVRADELQSGDVLAKYKMPVVEDYTIHDGDAYSQGFYSGDGNTDSNFFRVYEPKYMCINRLTGTFGEEHMSTACVTWKHGAMLDKTFVPTNGTVEYCLHWLAGLSDADGTIDNDREGGQALTISSIDREFLLQTRLMLTRLGVQARIGIMKHHAVNTCFRLVINGYDLYHLHEIGLEFTRLSYLARKPNRSARRSVKVIAVESAEDCETFCFTDEKNHTGTFNGIVTGQCGEATLNILGAFCVLADLVPYHCESLDEVEDTARAVVRALIRVNSMDSVFKTEVQRTNRIGVGLTGVHEFAWKFFGFGFRDLLDETKSKSFWLTLARINRAVYDEAESYSKEIGLPTPHTVTVVKPSGSVSKIFLLTEGWHLPARREFLRWVQFRNDDPLVAIYKSAGYPTRELVHYTGTTIVGFPTAPTLTGLGMGDALVTASEATPEEHFKWLMLGEKYWIHGTDRDGQPVKEEYGQSISYTLQYDPKTVSLRHFQDMLLKYQGEVRCCAVMPVSSTTAYEYNPEQGVLREEYMEMLARIQEAAVAVTEGVAREHVDCASGGCPVAWDENNTEENAIAQAA